MPKTFPTPNCSEQPSREELERARRWREALEKAHVPKRHWDFDKPTGSEWTAKLARLAPQIGSGTLVALIGPRGTGKTQLAVELIRRHVADSDKPWPVYARAIEIFMWLRESFGPANRTEAEAVRAFTAPKLLVIDEAHERGGSDWENRLLTYIIDVRYAEMRDTILVSNETLAGFKAAIGSSIYSRLTETGGVIVCDWPSFRIPPAQAARMARA